MNIVFMGASSFGLRCLETAINIPDIKISGILTAPLSIKTPKGKADKEMNNVLYVDFHEVAHKLGIPIIEINGSMKDQHIVSCIQSWEPEFILVVGWYSIVPRIILDIPAKGMAGLHGSLLPNYRGGAPLVWGIINGEQRLGISFFYFDEGIDNGDIITQREVTVKLNDTIATLYKRIEEEGIEILKEMLPLISNGIAPRYAQASLTSTNQSTWPLRTPDDGLINWNAYSFGIYNFIRAQTKPYPGAFTYLKGKKITIWESKLFDWSPKSGQEGEAIGFVTEGPLRGILVATRHNDCPLLLTNLEVDGRNYTGEEFIENQMLSIGDVLGR